MTAQINLKTKFDALNTLEAKGTWLGKKYRSLVNSDRKAITEFDLPLGQLLEAIRMENPDKPQLPVARLRECGVANIDRRRRSEALTLAQNWEHKTMQELVNSKRFSSCATLVREFKKLTAEEKPPVSKTPEQIAQAVADMLEKHGISHTDFAKAMASHIQSSTVSEAA